MSGRYDGLDPETKAWAQAWDAVRERDKEAVANRLDTVSARIAQLRAEIAGLVPEQQALIRDLSAAGLSLRRIAPIARLSHVAVGEIVNGRPYEPRTGSSDAERRAAIESDLAPLVSSPRDQAMAEGIAAALAAYGVEGVDLGPQP